MGSVSGRATVAIWGSCVTRDAFAAPERAAELAERLPLVHYTARTSWISQASRPLLRPGADLGGTVTEFGRRLVRSDLEKTVVDQLVAHRPDILVLDLIDERLPLARVGRSWVTVSDYFRQTEAGPLALATARRVNAVTDPRRPRLFAAATRRLVPELVRRLPGTTFVLNEAPYTTRAGDGTAMPEPNAGWARQLAAAQQPLLDLLVARFGDRLVRAVPPAHVCLADLDHRWGVATYHYVPAYYDWLLDTLLSLTPSALTLPTGHVAARGSR